ncbi:hypothetical protein Patl1_08494 [Pistacia atlantica]|uniref:Uncharacterized protein n=1 Tax=Pistacia atlantica TaxID=434234 RepID=A0ACC1AK83_9ROSI|nr:hypothetical protein Patl1_08494 [Pistacia atlantica]
MWFTDCVVPALRARRAVGKIALCACIIGCLKVDAFGLYVEYQPLVHQFTGLVGIHQWQKDAFTFWVFASRSFLLTRIREMRLTGEFTFGRCYGTFFGRADAQEDGF